MRCTPKTNATSKSLWSVILAFFRCPPHSYDHVAYIGGVSEMNWHDVDEVRDLYRTESVNVDGEKKGR